MEETIRTELVNGIVSMREEAVCRWHTASCCSRQISAQVRLLGSLLAGIT